MTESALAGIKIEYGEMVAALYCAKLLGMSPKEIQQLADDGVFY